MQNLARWTITGNNNYSWSLLVAFFFFFFSAATRCGASNIFASHDNASTALCDGSKCRAKRIHPWVDNDSEFTCWVPPGKNVTADPSFCTDGYIPRLLEGDNKVQKELAGATYEWYTCCPPEEPEVIVVLEQQCDDRACSSPDWEGGGNCWADGFQEPMTCSSGKFRYPRMTGLVSMIYLQYVCCTSPSYTEFDQELLLARIIWVVLSAITLIACTIFILGILSSREARSQGFNLYLVFLAFPDAIANLFILIRNYLTINGTPVDPTIHIFLASFEYFYAASNMWLNAVIVHQIYCLLKRSSNYCKIAPPSRKKVCKQAAGIYIWAFFWFAWAFFLYYRGLIVFSLGQVVQVWIVTRVFMVAPPLFYVVYICFIVWQRKLLPVSGRTRVLSLYFLRVVFIFLVTWVPYFILYEIAWNVTESRWMVNCSYYLGSVQGLLSVIVAMSKPDIRRAVVKFLCCRCSKIDVTTKRRPSTKVTVPITSNISVDMNARSGDFPAPPKNADDGEWREKDVWRDEETGEDEEEG